MTSSRKFTVRPLPRDAATDKKLDAVLAAVPVVEPKNGGPDSDQFWKGVAEPVERAVQNCTPPAHVTARQVYKTKGA
jgi:hypothetical protein